MDAGSRVEVRSEVNEKTGTEPETNTERNSGPEAEVMVKSRTPLVAGSNIPSVNELMEKVGGKSVVWIEHTGPRFTVVRGGRRMCSQPIPPRPPPDPPPELPCGYQTIFNLCGSRQLGLRFTSCSSALGL